MLKDIHYYEIIDDEHNIQNRRLHTLQIFAFMLVRFCNQISEFLFLSKSQIV